MKKAEKLDRLPSTSGTSTTFASYLRLGLNFLIILKYFKITIYIYIVKLLHKMYIYICFFIAEL